MGKTGKGQAMANKKFVVKLSGEERAQLTGLISKGKTAAKTVHSAEDRSGRGWRGPRR